MRSFVGFPMRVFNVAVLLVLMFCPATALCLDNSFWNTGLNFRLYPPGARSLGMGGAFVGLADDVTAAASNPAGIAQLTRMQLAVEGRYITFDKKENSFQAGLTPGNILSGVGVQTTSDEDDITEISFGAFSTPVFNNLFTLAVFYDRPMSFNANKIIDFSAGSPRTLIQRTESTTDISIDEVGISLGKSFADGRLMLGFGLGLQFFNMDAKENAANIFGGSFRNSLSEDEVGLSYRVGLLAKPIDNLRLGASYTVMPKFDTDVRFRNFFLGFPTFSGEYNTDLDVPDNFAIGLAYNILPNWVAVFEAKYVMYSQLMSQFRTGRVYDVNLPASDSQYTIDDAMEIHFGTEYVVNAIQNVPIALRAGFYYEPAHDLEYTGNDQLQKGLFDGGDDLWHFTLGTGVVLFNHYQIDVGADITDEGQNVALSMVYQF